MAKSKPNYVTEESLRAILSEMFQQQAGTAPNVNDGIAENIVDATNAAKTAGTAANGIALGDAGKAAWDWIKANPGKSVVTGLLGAANVGGLFDNQYLLGQAAGGVLGGFAPKIFEAITKTPLITSPLGRANLIMGGGALGALFDNLRARAAEQEQAKYQAQQYYGR